MFAKVKESIKNGGLDNIVITTGRGQRRTFGKFGQNVFTLAVSRKVSQENSKKNKNKEEFLSILHLLLKLLC